EFGDMASSDTDWIAAEDRPRVLVVTAAYPCARAPRRGQFIHALHRDLAPDFRSEVLAPRIRTDDPAEERWEGIPVTRFRYRSGDRTPKHAGIGLVDIASYLIAGDRAARRLWPSPVVREKVVVLAHWVVPSGWIGRRVARRWNAPLVLFAHGSDLTRYARAPGARSVAGSILRSARVVVGASRELVAIAEQLAGRPIDGRVAPVGVDETFFDARTRSESIDASPRPLRLLFVGDGLASKGLPLLLDAVRRCGPGVVELAVIGEGPVIDAIDRTRDPAVRVLGVCSPEEIAAEMRRRDGLVLPSEREGTPVVVQEAIVSQLPVIATAVGGIPDLFVERSGWTAIPVGDSDALFRVLREWIDGGPAAARARREAMASNETRSLARSSTVAALRTVLEEVL
ncbi:MAG: glycosyltransferase, partial [Planctomycetes bacterium]|nr:glycosyltransferase [Planctomycetota bacterium]